MGRGSMIKKRKPKEKRVLYNEMTAFEKTATRIWMKAIRPVCIMEAFVLFLNIALTVLKDYFGFGKVRLERFARHCLDYMDSIGDRYVEMEEIVDEVENFSGIRYQLTKNEVDQLEQYGMIQASKDIELSAIQMGYLKFDGLDKRMKKGTKK